MILAPDEIKRYVSQISLPHFGLEGQNKLKRAKVLCIGAGGLGSSFLLYLVGAGIGTLGIVEEDHIEISNLHRQIIYDTDSLGEAKINQTKNRLLALNPYVTVETYAKRLNRSNAADIIKNYDIIADCSDNFDTRYLINDVCYALNKPYVFASVSQYQGQCGVFHGNACFRCLFDEFRSHEESLNCQNNGVLGVLPGLLGLIQATETMKWILNLGESLQDILLTVDILSMNFEKYHLTKNPNCRLCARHETLERLMQETLFNELDYAISADQLKSLLEKNKEVILIDVRSQDEHAIDNIGGTLIPLPQLHEKMSTLNPHQNFILYCRSGVRSVQALKILLENNFTSLKYLSGGLTKWREIYPYNR